MLDLLLQCYQFLLVFSSLVEVVSQLLVHAVDFNFHEFELSEGAHAFVLFFVLDE